MIISQKKHFKNTVPTDDKKKRKKEKAQQRRNKGELPQPDNRHLQKSTGNIIFNDENKQTNLNVFPSKIRNKARTSVCTTFIQYLARAKRRIIKSVQIQNEDIKLGFFTDDVILYVENPQRSIKTPLEVINKVSKAAQYKITIQNSIVFPYTRNKQSKNEMKEKIPFTIASKRIKCLGISLTKELQDLKH